MRTVVLCLLLAQVASAQPLDAFIAQKMDEAGIMGLGAAVIVDDKVVWMKGYGFADKQRAVPFTPNTVMNVGSISKTFTGVAVMVTLVFVMYNDFSPSSDACTAAPPTT